VVEYQSDLLVLSCSQFTLIQDSMSSMQSDRHS